ncbi:hypothetical protein E7Y31_09985 [Candidatus Frankia alpina]|uniref:Uncharacterized protein n=1 Tax=Candidatus Frankia alpina TaxID=2699483 RepID=A0A4S5EQL1_9ACTN|nr:hypothetical protein E7Y31_09985 [Candidatus Frankia alpina]
MPVSNSGGCPCHPVGRRRSDGGGHRRRGPAARRRGRTSHPTPTPCAWPRARVATTAELTPAVVQAAAARAGA